MRKYRGNEEDPIEIGVCAGCGHPIYSNENHWLDGENMIHADGVGAMATIVDKPGKVKISCLLLYMENICMEDEVAKALEIERVRA